MVMLSNETVAQIIAHAMLVARDPTAGTTDPATLWSSLPRPTRLIYRDVAAAVLRAMEDTK